VPRKSRESHESRTVVSSFTRVFRDDTPTDTASGHNLHPAINPHNAESLLNIVTELEQPLQASRSLEKSDLPLSTLIQRICHNGAVVSFWICVFSVVFSAFLVVDLNVGTNLVLMTVFSALLSIRYISRSLLVIFGYVLGSNIDYVAARVREELKIDQNRTQSPEKYYALSFRRFRIYGE
jgi:hypothetical protein